MLRVIKQNFLKKETKIVLKMFRVYNQAFNKQQRSCNTAQISFGQVVETLPRHANKLSYQQNSSAVSLLYW